MIRKFFIVAVLFTLGACSKDTDSGNAGAESTPATTGSAEQAQEDLADLTKYDLSMARMDKYFQTMRNMAETLKNMTPEQREASQMRTDNNASLDQMVDHAEKNEIIKDATRKAGSSPREYVMTSLSYFTSAMAMSVLQMQPNANQDSIMREMKVNPDNVKFIKDNEAELTTKYKAMEAEMSALEALDEAEGN